MKKWARALALALVAHAVIVGVCWVGARSVAGHSRAPRPENDVVELEALAPPVSPPPAVAPAPRTTADSSVPYRSAQAPRARHATRAAAATPALALDSAPASAPALPSASPPQPSPPSAPRPVEATPVAAPATVNLQLKHDPTAAAAAPGGTAALRPGETVETTTLRGQVGRDGSLAIRDKAPVHIGSDVVSMGPLLKDWLKDPKEHSAGQDGTLHIMSGSFDATDALMRAYGQDPYRAERMKLLESTREQRLAMATRDRAARQREQLAALPARLRAIWSQAERPAQERRRLLFALWDECEEAAPGDDRRGSAGESAREMILVFIRAHAAPDSPQAYGRQELVALNAARESRQRFEPYAARSW